jgi:Animal haem peroxidase
MAMDLLQRIGGLLNRRPWYELPNLLAAFRLVDIRNELREKNLHDTEEPPFQPAGQPGPGDPPRDERTIDGTFNDLGFPKMGSAGCRFGRNFALEHVFPDVPTLLVPNPRLVSRELMTRDRFKPAHALNLLAASWIQFMVHDWFVHDRSKSEAITIPTPADDDFGAANILVPRSVPSPAPAGSRRPPAYANLNSHWWDGSQIYGGDAATAAALRTGISGRLRIEPTGLLPVDPVTGVHFSGFTDNWWIGLAMLHTLFTLEHNHICDLLAAQYPDWSDDKLFAKARLINGALMAKIHTVEWTCAIVPHPLIQRAMNVIWSGLAGAERQEVLEFIEDRELLGGIVGSNADHHTAPYSLTEEFVSV